MRISVFILYILRITVSHWRICPLCISRAMDYGKSSAAKNTITGRVTRENTVENATNSEPYNASPPKRVAKMLATAATGQLAGINAANSNSPRSLNSPKRHSIRAGISNSRTADTR